MVKPYQSPILPDERIAELIEETKPVPTDWQARLLPSQRRAGHRRATLEIFGTDGNRFIATTRQSESFAENFSAILIHRTADGHAYRLLRCNGLHPGGHRNSIEDSDFGTTFHVHRATERYQVRGLREDGFAEETSAYSSLSQAIRHLGDIANFELMSGQQEMPI